MMGITLVGEIKLQGCGGTEEGREFIIYGHEGLL